MSVYTYTTARQQLAKILDQAEANEAVFIRRRNGRLFVIQAVADTGSGLDVPSLGQAIPREELQSWLDEARDRSSQ